MTIRAKIPLAVIIIIVVTMAMPDPNSFPMPPGPSPANAWLLSSFPAIESLPDWVVHTSPDCFVGVSGPLSSLEEARREAISSALAQIVQAMGAEYRLNHESRLSGNHQHSKHDLQESLTYSAKWFVDLAGRNIKEWEFSRTERGYFGFVLIHFPPAQLDRLRGLSIGPLLRAEVIQESTDRVVVRLKEINGEAAYISSYRVTLLTQYRHAQAISLFLWKVPASSRKVLEGRLESKVQLKRSEAEVSLPRPVIKPSLKSAILGAEPHYDLTLLGHDEIGRPVSVAIDLR